MVYNKCVPNFILKVVVHKVLLWLNLWPSQKVCNWLTIRTTLTNLLYSWTQSSLNSIRRTLHKQIWLNNVTEMFCFSLGENAPILCLFCVFVRVLCKILTWECELVMGRWRMPQGMWCIITNKNDTRPIRSTIYFQSPGCRGPLTKQKKPMKWRIHSKQIFFSPI